LLAASSLAAGKPVLGKPTFRQEHRLEAASALLSSLTTPPAKQPTHHRLRAIGIAEIQQKKGRRRLDEATVERLQAKLRAWILSRNRSRPPTQLQSRKYVEGLPDAKPFKGTTIERRVVRPIHQELKLRRSAGRNH
jgi:hypothetical protein